MATCNRCADCALRGAQIMNLAIAGRFVDNNNDLETEISDTLCHLMHLAELQDVDIWAAWDQARLHFEAERSGEDCDEDCPKHGVKHGK